MKKKQIQNILVILVIMLLIMLINSNIVQAVQLASEESSEDITIEDVTGGAKDFIQSGTSQDNPLDIGGIQNVTDVLYNILLAVGIIVAVIVGLFIGIKYMTGSVVQKSETKQLLLPYIVGCVVIFGAFGIWKLVVELLNQTQT